MRERIELSMGAGVARGGFPRIRSREIGTKAGKDEEKAQERL